MAHMVMPAGIDAARDLDLQRADLMFQIQFLKAQRDPDFGHRNGAGRRKGAVIHAGAGDDVGNQPDIRRGQPRAGAARHGWRAGPIYGHAAGSRSVHG